MMRVGGERLKGKEIVWKMLVELLFVVGDVIILETALSQGWRRRLVGLLVLPIARVER